MSELLSALHEIAHEDALPKNIRQKINKVIVLLEQNTSLSKSQARDQLEEVMNDQVIEGFTRTQLFTVMSMFD